ncbi:MAG: sigma-70 family RNA polymerase sigma factor [Oscillospiraceae bacterium]
MLRRHGYELSDLTQEGYSALVYAVEQFDKDKPYKFTTYLNYALKHVTRRLLNNKDVLSQAGSDTMSLVQFDQPIGEDKDGGELLLSDIVPDEQASRGFEQAERADEFQPLYEAVDSLPERERDII